MRYSFFARLWKSKRFFAPLQLSVMTLAIAPLILVQQFSGNMVKEISNRIIETSDGHMQLRILRARQNERSISTARHSLKNIDGIESAFLEIRGGGILRKGTRRSGVSLRGVEPMFLQERRFRRYVRPVQGTLSVRIPNTIVLGAAIAEDLDAKVGDTILLLTTQSVSPSLPPKITRLRVTGIFTTNYRELDRGWSFVSTTTTKTVLASPDQRWFLSMKTTDPFAFPNPIRRTSPRMRSSAIDLLNSTRSALDSLGPVRTWYENKRDQFDLFSSTRILLYLVMLIAILLATITLSSIMGLRIIDLEPDIALLKALGSNPYALERQVLLQALWCGLISSLCGASLGLGLSMSAQSLVSSIDGGINALRFLFGAEEKISLLSEDFYVQNFSFRPLFMELFIAIGGTIVLSVCAAIIPMRRLRNIPALKILRTH